MWWDVECYKHLGHLFVIYRIIPLCITKLCVCVWIQSKSIVQHLSSYIRISLKLLSALHRGECVSLYVYIGTCTICMYSVQIRSQVLGVPYLHIGISSSCLYPVDVFWGWFYCVFSYASTHWWHTCYAHPNIHAPLYSYTWTTNTHRTKKQGKHPHGISKSASWYTACVVVVLRYVYVSVYATYLAHF